MDVSGGRDALVFLCFLGQADTTTTNDELQEELLALSRDLDKSRINNNNNNKKEEDHGGCRPPMCAAGCDPDSGEELQTDGHLQSNVALLRGDLQPQVDLHEPENQIDPVALRAMIVEMRAIADQFDHSVVVRATDSLAKKLSNSTKDLWKAHLTMEVEWVVKHSLGFDLPRERVMMALALTLVKGVCERTPRMLRSLFQTTLQYFG
ncbi:hypothetical protein CRUP_009443 [Coryphaenoides rupestris]|nr:hypothetical protein CRUP_009443 [Coryphaenoides rupestris]